MRVGLVQTGQILKPSPDETVEKRQKRDAVLARAISQAQVIGLDIETGYRGDAPLNKDGTIDYSELTPQTGEIKSIQICIPGFTVSGQMPVVQLLGDECRREGRSPVLDALLAHVTAKGKWTAIHNALYEGEWFYATYGVLITNPFCTMVAHQMATAGLASAIDKVYGSANSLKTVVERKLGVVISKELQTSDWAGELTDEQSRYAMFDAYLTYKLYLKFRYLLDTPAGRAEMGSVPMFSFLNATGMPASLPHLKELSTKYGESIARREAELQAQVDVVCQTYPRLRETLIPKSASKKKRASWVFNLGSSQQVLKLINALLESKGLPTVEKTDASTLEKIELPFAQQLSEYRSLVKLKGYVDVFINNYRLSSGTVMCRYSVLAYKAAAGRSSASDGSLQIVGNTSPTLAKEGLGGPKTAFAHSRVEPGCESPHVAIKCDLPASHLQLVAALTDDDLLTYCLSNDEKVHYHTLSRMLQLMGVAATFQQVKDYFTKPNHGGVVFVRPNGEIITEAEMKALYTAAKNVIYSFINFAGAVSLQSTFFKKRIRTTVEECKIFLQACKDMYAKVYGFQRKVARAAESAIEVIWDEPEYDSEVVSLASHYGAVRSTRGSQFLTRAVRWQMPDGRWLYFPAYAQPVADELADFVDTADDVEWKCRPANIVAAHWLATEATIMKSVAAQLMEVFGQNPEWKASIRAFAHDEVVIWVLAQHAPEVSQLYMDLVTQEFRRFVPFFQPEAPTVMENWEKSYQYA